MTRARAANAERSRRFWRRVRSIDRDPSGRWLATRAMAGRRGRLGRRVNSVRARTLGALLDLELDLLTADEAVEVQRVVEGAAVEEVFLRILGGDEAEAAVGDDLLDGTGGHIDLQHFPNRGTRTHGPFEKGVDHAAPDTQRAGP